MSEKTLVDLLARDASRFIEKIITGIALDVVFVNYHKDQHVSGFWAVTKDGQQHHYFCEGHQYGYGWSPEARFRINTLRANIETFLADFHQPLVEGHVLYGDEPGPSILTYAISSERLDHHAERTQTTFNHWLKRVLSLEPTTIDAHLSRINQFDPPGTDRGDTAPFTGGYGFTATWEGKPRAYFYGNSNATAQWLLLQDTQGPLSKPQEEQLHSAVLSLLDPLRDRGYMILED